MLFQSHLNLYIYLSENHFCLELTLLVNVWVNVRRVERKKNEGSDAFSVCVFTGEKGTSKTTGKKLCFKGSTFHRIVKNFMVQGGDFTEGRHNTSLASENSLYSH